MAEEAQFEGPPGHTSQHPSRPAPDQGKLDDLDRAIAAEKVRIADEDRRGDLDLAERLRERADYLHADPGVDTTRNLLREAATRLCASTHPEQSGRVYVDDLAALEDGWDGYGKGCKITDAALATARHTQIVPLADGGLQMEWHIAGFDCEIEIQPDGKITSFYVEPA